MKSSHMEELRLTRQQWKQRSRDLLELSELSQIIKSLQLMRRKLDAKIRRQYVQSKKK